MQETAKVSIKVDFKTLASGTKPAEVVVPTVAVDDKDADRAESMNAATVNKTISAARNGSDQTSGACTEKKIA